VRSGSGGVRIGIIGGTGVYDPEVLTNVRTIEVETRYGAVELKVGEYKGGEVAFIARHGWKHSVPPHGINYRANIKALQILGVQRIIATSAVGSLRLEMQPGHFVVLDQFIDFTKSRPFTFFEGAEGNFRHIDFTEPYCPEIREAIIAYAKKLGAAVHPKGCYVCTEGPRFETPAEIRMFSELGADVVGMTNVPEVVLARELGMCYGTVAMVTNYAAGISPTPLTHEEVVDVMRQNSERIRAILMGVLEHIPTERGCRCGITKP